MIVTVCGGKGGVGKTTVALNLAARLDGVLVDADVGMADLPTDGGPTLHDVLAGRVAVEDALRGDWAVGVVPSGRSLAGARAIDLERLETVLSRLSRRYAFVVVDAPGGFEADAAVPIVAGDAAVLVTVPEPASLADALRTRSLARELGTGVGAVVLNKAARPRPAVTDRLGGPQFAVEESAAIESAQRAGLPVELDGAGSDIVEQFEAVAAHLRRLARDRRIAGSPG